MKKVLLLTLLGVTFFINSFSQDVIFKKDGTQVTAKVSEITVTVVKYKKFTNQSGPTYELAKTEIIKIVYPDGSVDDFSKEAENSARNSVENLKELMKANVSAGYTANGKSNFKLNNKDYSTEFNSLSVNEVGRQTSMFFKNRSAIYMTLTSTVISDSKTIVLSFNLTQNDMKPGTFKAKSSNELELVDKQFTVAISYLNPNMYNGIGGGNALPINNIKVGKMIIESIDKESRTMSGSYQVIGSTMDGGKIDLQGAFSNVSY